MAETKTIQEWLETLPEPYRSQALNNAYECLLGLDSNSLSIALMTAFKFKESNEGVEYWHNFTINLES